MKFFKTIIIFLFIFFIGQMIISNVLDSVVSRSSFRITKLYFKTKKMDNKVLCIGDSRGVNSFYSPYIDQKYSTKSYNLSYNGLRMPLVEIFLDDYLKNHKIPKIVFIEISSLFNSESTINYSEFNIYSSKSNKLNARIKSSDESTYLTSAIFPIYRYNSELLYRNIFYLNKKSDQDWINRYTISKELEDEILEMTPFNLQINKKDFNVLKQIIKKLGKKNINVYLFVAPYHPNYLTKMKNLNDLIKNIKRVTGASTIDISGFLQNREYFADKIHTNEKGALLISDTLMKSTMY